MPSSGDKDFAVPYFTAESVSLVNPRPVRFFSAATQAYVVASLSGAHPQGATGIRRTIMWFRFAGMSMPMCVA